MHALLQNPTSWRHTIDLHSGHRLNILRRLTLELLLLLGPLGLLVLLGWQLEVLATAHLQLLVRHRSVSWCVLAST